MIEPDDRRDDEDRQRWHFDSRFTLGELFTMLGVIVMICFKGNAITLNGHAVTWLGGNVPSQVKGAVS